MLIFFIMKEELVRTLGKEKQNKFNDNLDFIVNDNFITENLDIDQFEVID